MKRFCVMLFGFLFLTIVSVSAQSTIMSATFESDLQSFMADFGGTTTVTWSSAYDNTGGGGGCLEANSTTSATNNENLAVDLTGALRFTFFTTTDAAELDLSSYVFIATPLTEVTGISSGSGGAALALIDGAVDFTGVITPSAERILDNSAFELLTAPTLTVGGSGRMYNTWLLIRNATGIAYFDDILVVEPSAVRNWDVY